MIQEHAQQVIGAGTGVTTASVALGFAAAVPILQAVSLTIGIVVGVLTAVYTYRRIKSKKYD